MTLLAKILISAALLLLLCYTIFLKIKIHLLNKDKDEMLSVLKHGVQRTLFEYYSNEENRIQFMNDYTLERENHFFEGGDFDEGD